jgi:hypothetical protein
MRKAIRAAICVLGGAALALLLAVLTQELLFVVFHDQVSRDSLSQPWDNWTPIAYPVAWLVSSLFLWRALGFWLAPKTNTRK